MGWSISLMYSFTMSDFIEKIIKTIKSSISLKHKTKSVQFLVGV